jgi:Fic-DOC domain mobile mystery protein B
MELNENETGETPLDEEEREGLKLHFISLKSELNEFEQQNIEDAMAWLEGKQLSQNNILSQKFICQLHDKMFCKVWKWSGKFRNSDKNIGTHYKEIPVALKILCDDTLYWIENKIFDPDEIAIRFKHKLVSIHCFPNGNGRHSRLMADIIIEKVFGENVFTWGMHLNASGIQLRETYIKSIRAADQNNYEALLEFCRT